MTQRDQRGASVVRGVKCGFILPDPVSPATHLLTSSYSNNSPLGITCSVCTGILWIFGATLILLTG